MHRLLLLFSTTFLSAGPLLAQVRADSGAFVLRLGRDTVVFERYVRTGDHLLSEAVWRSPRVVLQRVEARLNPDGSLARVDGAVYDPSTSPGAQPVSRTSVVLRGDSTHFTAGSGGSRQSWSFPGRAHFSPAPQVFALFELLARRAPRNVGDSAVLTQMSPAGPRPLVVRRSARDSVTVSSRQLGTMHAHVDEAGRVWGLDGRSSSWGFVGERRAWVDLDSVARAFLAHENQHGALGELSPRDSVVALAHGARIQVDYGRPSRRGRTIFGGVVPWGRVWRTGANLATHFTTDRALSFDGRTLPAGTYTLWTIPGPAEWTLIVNQETGQWGTFYDETRDLWRIPMRTRRTPVPAEQFTILIQAQGEGGVLKLVWETTEASAEFRVK